MSKLTHVVATTDLSSRLELKLRWSESSCWNRTTLWPRFHSPPLGTVGLVANAGGVPQFLALGACRGALRARKAFSALGSEASVQRLWRRGTRLLAGCGFGRNGPQRQVRIIAFT